MKQLPTVGSNDTTALMYKSVCDTCPESVAWRTNTVAENTQNFLCRNYN